MNKSMAHIACPDCGRANAIPYRRLKLGSSYVCLQCFAVNPLTAEQVRAVARPRDRRLRAQAA